MKIKDLQIDGFGVWKGLQVDDISDNVTVFYGQNEAGKTTLMQFIRSMMFGFSSERREKYVPPVYGGLAGGTASVVAPGGKFEIQRHVDPNRHADAMGDLTVIDSDTGDVHGNATLATLLANVDEPIFSNVFAVGLREIQELGALNNTQAADHLYRLTSGLDRVSLVDVMRDLKNRRESIWSDSPKNDSRIAILRERRQKLLREIDEQRSKAKRWAKIAAQTKEYTVRQDEINSSLKRLEKDARLVELSLQIQDRWNARDIVEQQINAFGKLPDPREISVSSLDQINSKINKQKERITQIKAERKKIRKHGDSLGINRTLWDLRTHVEALQAHTPWIESLERQAEQFRSEINRIESHVNGEIKGLGSQVSLKNRDLSELSTRGISSLKTLAQNLTDQQKRLVRLKDEADKAKFELTQHEKSLGDSLSETTGNIPDSLEDTSRQVNRLRRRIELDEKIDKLQKNRGELEMDIDNIVEEQVLPVGKLAMIGAVFITGFLLMGWGLMTAGVFGEYLQTSSNSAKEVGIVTMMMSLVCGFAALGLKYHWERTARDSMDDFRHQMELVKTQLKRAKDERDEIDRTLPGNGGQYVVDLQDAEARLQRLEGLVPMENRAKSSRMKLEDLRRQITGQEREVEECEKRWQGSLRTLGLPESLTPTQVREISVRSNRVADYSSRLEELRRELSQRESETEQINSRVQELLAKAGVRADKDTARPLSALRRLNALLNDQRQLLNQRGELQQEYKGLKVQLERARREMARLFGQRTKLLAAVGADSEDDYRHFDLKHVERNKLYEKQNQLTAQIEAGLGKGFREDDVRPLLTSYGKSGLEKKWEQQLAEIDQLKEEHTKLVQLRGERLQELRLLGEDATLDNLRLELNVVEAELEQRREDWQTYASTSQLLDTIREGYEAKRQPETLKEASLYLEQLTEGHYTRIWTRLVGEELLVDNEDDETITVDKLSRGTREAVYLSLRLALVTVFARRGAVLPLVLDDILVNFDAYRMKSAAKLLVDFARNGYQILMFTCHDHMRDLFHSLEADVLVLPAHKDVVEHDARPVRYRPGIRQFVPEPVIEKPVVEKPVIEKPAVTLVERKPISRTALEFSSAGFDPELQFEMSAINSDVAATPLLRHELIYRDEKSAIEFDLSEELGIWASKKGRQTA
ncbi:MAG: AAA family ATPase [Pirellulaceae bacterium]